MTPETPLSLREEIANAVTHGLGVLLAVGGGAVLITLAALYATGWHILGASVFVGSLVLLYTASTLYHAIPFERARRRLQTFDHCAIYVLIAGTYTPFLITDLRGPLGWSLLATIWVLAIGGVVFKLFFTGRWRGLSTAFYIGMGWLAAVAFQPMREALPGAALAWIVAGGVAYTAGTVFYLSQRRYAHAVWHGFVLAGSVCHFAAVLLTVLHA
jgi:hemolysin III